jgi:hypothetical protein
MGHVPIKDAIISGSTGGILAAASVESRIKDVTALLAPASSRYEWNIIHIYFNIGFYFSWS